MIMLPQTPHVCCSGAVCHPDDLRSHELQGPVHSTSFFLRATHFLRQTKVNYSENEVFRSKSLMDDNAQ